MLLIGDEVVDHLVERQRHTRQAVVDQHASGGANLTVFPDYPNP